MSGPQTNTIDRYADLLWHNRDATTASQVYTIQPHGYRRPQIPDSEKVEFGERFCTFAHTFAYRGTPLPRISPKSFHRLKACSYHVSICHWVFGCCCFVMCEGTRQLSCSGRLCRVTHSNCDEQSVLAPPVLDFRNVGGICDTFLLWPVFDDTRSATDIFFMHGAQGWKSLQSS